MLSSPVVGAGVPTPADRPAEAPAPAWRGRRAAIAGAAAVVVLVLTAVAFYHWGSAGATPVAAPTPSAKPSPSAAPTTAKIYSAVAPSVVSIAAIRPDSSKVTGTGVIANADGTIVTALHVVQGAVAIEVTFADGTPSKATISGADPATDIATLAPASMPSVLVPAVLGRADRLAVGDAVIAIGDPLGLTRTTTTGIVSGLNRSAAGTDGTLLAGLIQFDAAVNPGSSGGPLVNAKGETVGIVVALANPTDAGTFIGIGFAVPISTAVAGGGGRTPPQ